jgi:dTDP-D-glucose 4,6-dehydratase
MVNLDKLTYAGNLRNLVSVKGDLRHVFVQGDICDRAQRKRFRFLHVSTNEVCGSLGPQDPLGNLRHKIEKGA